MAQNVVKSYNAFRVNEGLLAKVVEAIKSGETMARRSGVLRTFEVSYHAHREDLVLGHISLVPAKLADNFEDFPAALLYGAVIKSFKGEDVADLYHAKIGESEFDEYDHVNMQKIKDQLFKDVDGVYRTLVVFQPAWTGARDVITFHFIRKDELLLQAVRHMIYSAYYDPALSNGFEAMSNDLETLSHDVTDVTPKLNFPFLAESLLKEYPELVPAEDVDGVNPLTQYPHFLAFGVTDTKTAGARRPKTVLAADTVGDVAEEILEPGEKAVIDQLGQDLAAIVDKVAEPIELAESTPVTGETEIPAVDDVKTAKTIDGTDATGLRNKPDYGEPGSYTSDAQERMFLWCDTDEGKWRVLNNSGERLFSTTKKDEAQAFIDANKGKKAATIDGSDATGLRNKPDYGEPGSYTSDANEASIANTKEEKTAADHQTTYAGWKSTIKKQHPEAHFEGDKGICQAFKTKGGKGVGEWDGDKGSVYKAAEAKPIRKQVLAKDYALLLEVPSKGKIAFVAVSPTGHVEIPGFAQGHLAFKNPAVFPASFRVACAKFFEDRKKEASRKKADVPLTFDEIWNEVTEDLGEAPQVPVKLPSDQPAAESSEPAAESSEPSNAPGESPVAPTEPAAEPTNELPFEKKQDEEEKQAAAKKRAAKVAAFNIFNPAMGVIDEFYPELEHEEVDSPNDGHTPMELDRALDALPDGKYLPSSPAGALGIGDQGKAQVLDGIPLRQENDIRGYGFSDEFYGQTEGISPKAFVASWQVLVPISKKASPSDWADQFGHFLKGVIGEVAAAFIAAFKVTQRPLMSKVPGVGKVQLDQYEQPSALPNGNLIDVGSRVRFLAEKLNDSDLQEVINNAWAQSSVWNTSEDGGYTYEVFVRASKFDRDTLALSYEFVVGTKGL
jgi:hypothetical protein